MGLSFPLRQSVGVALAANVLRPPRAAALSVPTFLAGWVAGELAPQLATMLVADAVRHTWRHGVRTTSDAVGVGLTGAAVVMLGATIAESLRSRRTVVDAFRTAVGPVEAERLDDELGIVDLAVPWTSLALPFRMRDRSVTTTRNIAYARGGRRLRMDVLRPRERSATPAPCLVNIHGGGWIIGRKGQQGMPLMMQLLGAGWVCADVNYPLSPRAKWPDHLVGVKRAVAYLREHAEELGIDPDFIAVTGGSAGGHLAAMMALTAGVERFQPGFADADTSVQAAVPMYGVYDLPGDTGLHWVRARRRAMGRLIFGRGDVTDDELRDASPIGHLRADAPPVFIVHGASDTLLPPSESALFAERLAEVSDDVVAYTAVPGAQHAFDVFPSIRVAAVVRGTARFLQWALWRHHGAVGLPAGGVGEAPEVGGRAGG